MLVRLVQPEKVKRSMVVTLSGMVMLVRLLQKRKAFFPMPVTLSGIVMLVRLLQLKKAPIPMLVTGLPSMAAGMISSPDTSLSQPVIVTASPCISYFKPEGIWLHPPRSRGSVTDNSRTGLIIGTMPAARRRGYYKPLTRLHRPSPSPCRNHGAVHRLGGQGAVHGLGVRWPTTIRPPLCNRVPRFGN